MQNHFSIAAYVIAPVMLTCNNLNKAQIANSRMARSGSSQGVVLNSDLKKYSIRQPHDGMRPHP